MCTTFYQKKHFEKEEVKLVTMWKKFITHLSSEVFLIRIHFFCFCFLPLHLVAASLLLSFQLKLKLFFTEKTCLPPKARLGVHVWHSQPLGVSPTTWYTYTCGLDVHLSHQNVHPIGHASYSSCPQLLPKHIGHSINVAGMISSIYKGCQTGDRQINKEVIVIINKDKQCLN